MALALLRGWVAAILVGLGFDGVTNTGAAGLVGPLTRGQ